LVSIAKRKRRTRTTPRPNPAAPGTSTNGPATKAERRDQARQERQALQRKMERGRRVRGLTTRVVIVLVVLGVAGGVPLLTRSPSPDTGPVQVSGAPSVNPATLPGILTGPAPWPANTEVYVDGTKQVVPGLIGISTSPQVVFSLSTPTTRAGPSPSSRPPSRRSRWASSSTCGRCD